ncbi:MAG TPA: VOC family protein [Actinotalea sp.]|nr:VOC family protein [Actinotalea sp.]
MIAGCTEGERLVGPDDGDLPCFPTTRIHVERALELALADDPAAGTDSDGTGATPPATDRGPLVTTGFDHVVLYCSDIGRTIAFYTSVLGMRHEVFDGGYDALHLGRQKINLHRADAPYLPHAAHPRAGGADICVLTQARAEVVLDHLAAHGVGVVEGPTPQTGARGTMTSVYIRDPDGNLVEISTYPERDAAPITRAGRS